MKKIIPILGISLLVVGCSPKLAFYDETPYSTMQGKVEQVTETNQPQNVVYTYTYNKQGQLLTSHYSSNNPKIRLPLLEETQSTLTYKKGSLVKLVSIKTSKNDGKKTTTTLQRIRHSKDKDTFVEYSSANSKVDTIQVTYNYAKQQKTETRRISPKVEQKKTTTYANNLRQKVEEYENGKLVRTLITTYNDKGLVIKTTDSQGKPSTNNTTKITSQYTQWDDKGNWTERKTLLGGDIQMTTNRQIVYK